MASIIKRKNSYCVVYRYTDEKGKSHQRWESFPTNAEARKRKNQIEYEQDNNVFTVPEARTVRELLVDYMEIYGVNKWAMSTYDAKNSLINNYINPIIGDIPLSDLNPRMMEKYYLDLLKVKSKVINNRKPDHQYLTPSRIREVHKLLRNAFNQAVKWELMTRNPVEHATIPKEKPKKRAMWDLPTFKKALELCDDDDLSLALNLAFSCTLRMGEMLGITLDCIDVSEDKIENGTASIFIEKELQRVKRDVFEKLNQRDVLFVFPRCLSGGNTVLVLKEPKTETSKRRVYLPKTVAKMVLQRIKDIQEIIEKRIAIHLLRVTVPGHHRPHQQNHLHQILIHRQVVIQAIAVPASVTVTAPEANRAVKPKMNIMPKTIITPRTSTRITMMTSSITRTQRTIITTISTIER
ncbi:tyrosine-type recombinase/integrase [Ruminococcus sp.]|jgi:hypothetical protein|uniref:tyrosine-type recombinase/integrase n=1 Tax=Ruminococcus sp. TaxID=41978 RepID=UPI003FD7469D